MSVIEMNCEHLKKNRILYLPFLHFVFLLPAFAEDFYYVNKEYTLTAMSFSKNQDRVEIVYPGDRVELVYLQENLEAVTTADQYIANVKFGKKVGFIPFKYIQKKKPLNIKNIRKRPFIEPKLYYVAVNSLPVRMEPNIESMPVISLSKNSEITVSRFTDVDEIIDGVPGRWAFFNKGRFEGWVFSGALSETKIEGVLEDISRLVPGKNYYINVDEIKIRSEPATLGTPVATVLLGERVEVLERKRALVIENGIRSSWVLVKYNEIEGWIFGGSLNEKKPEKTNNVIQKKYFQYPLDYQKSKMTSPFGSRIDPVTGKPGIRHTGIDLYPFARFGAPIYASGDGIVIHQSFNSGYGNLTVLQHSGGLVTYYAHQLKFLIKQNEKVKAGDLIGEVGSTGKSTGPHLHFEVRTGLWQDQLDPEKYIQVPGK